MSKTDLIWFQQNCVQTLDCPTYNSWIAKQYCFNFSYQFRISLNLKRTWTPQNPSFITSSRNESCIKLFSRMTYLNVNSRVSQITSALPLKNYLKLVFFVSLLWLVHEVCVCLEEYVKSLYKKRRTYSMTLDKKYVNQ